MARPDKIRIHQFHSGSSIADAVTNCMSFVRSMLESFGFASEIFAEHVDPALSGQVRRLGLMAGEIVVPDDFDRMGGAEIERMFGIAP